MLQYMMKQLQQVLSLYEQILNIWLLIYFFTGSVSVMHCARFFCVCVISPQTSANKNCSNEAALFQGLNVK